MTVRQPKYEEIYDEDNLGEAFREISKRRYAHPSWTKFTINTGDILCYAQLDLMYETYQPGPVTEFDITDPKPRHIIAPRLYDRLIHHALIRVTLPVFEAYLHPGSFACRKGKRKATVTALTESNEQVSVDLEAVKHFSPLTPDYEIKELGQEILTLRHGPVHYVRMTATTGRGVIYACVAYQKLMRKALGRWGKDFVIVSIDIKSFFASIPHKVVMAMIDRLFEDKRIVRLFGKIIDAIDAGLPIGFLPSQHESNLVGSAIDYFVTDIIGQPLYIRYADDIRILIHTRSEARETLEAVEELVTLKLGMALSEKKTSIKRFKGHDTFCGFDVHPHHFEAKKESLKRHERRCLKKERQYLEGALPLDKLVDTIQSARSYILATDAKSPKLEALMKRVEEYQVKEFEAAVR